LAQYLGLVYSYAYIYLAELAEKIDNYSLFCQRRDENLELRGLDSSPTPDVIYVPHACICMPKMAVKKHVG
jgi:hypothetical protein